MRSSSCGKVKGIAGFPAPSSTPTGPGRCGFVTREVLFHKDEAVIVHVYWGGTLDENMYGIMCGIKMKAIPVGWFLKREQIPKLFFGVNRSLPCLAY